MNGFDLTKVTVTDGFMLNRLIQNGTITAQNVYERFKETYRFGALECVKGNVIPHVFWDSDVAKWLEGVAYILSRKKDDKLKQIFDTTVDTLIKNQRKDGYFNSYFQVHEPEAIFTRRTDHELYCAGHLIEAGVAADKYLGDGRLLSFSIKFADYIYDRFYIKKDVAFTTPGHQEIELALVKLYRHTGKGKYLALAKFFLDERGKNPERECYDIAAERIQTQSDKPIREQTEVKGHAVRQLYQIAAMIDVGVESGDYTLIDTAKRLVDDVLNKKTYITGGVGSSHVGENFTNAYDLSNDTAYAETCASIALVLVLDRLYKVDQNPTYADAIERTLYNGIFSGLSIDGDKFFYVNPLETWIDKYDYNSTLGYRAERLYIPERVKVFYCSCCPPNVVRFTEQIPRFTYYEDDDTLTIAQYISANLNSNVADVKMKSDFPYSGKVSLSVNSHGKNITLKLRIPAWCNKSFKNATNGYIVFNGIFNDQIIQLDFEMKLQKVYPNVQIRADDGKIALSYGPLVLCAESKDNQNLCGIRIGNVDNAEIEILGGSPTVLKAKVPAKIRKGNNSLYTYETPTYQNGFITFIPYFAWGNRGKNDMKIFFTDD